MRLGQRGRSRWWCRRSFRLRGWPRGRGLELELRNAYDQRSQKRFNLAETLLEWPLWIHRRDRIAVRSRNLQADSGLTLQQTGRQRSLTTMVLAILSYSVWLRLSQSGHR